MTHMMIIMEWRWWMVFYFSSILRIIFLINIVKIILEIIADNYQRWLKFILEFSKVF